MTTCIGPKIKFEQLQQKINSFSYTYDQDKQDLIQQQGEKKVRFVDTSIVFLLYSDEEVYDFRERLKCQIQQKQIEPIFLNPSFCYSCIQNKKKSCFKQAKVHID